VMNALNALFWLSEKLSPWGAMFDGLDPSKRSKRVKAMGYSKNLET